VHKINLICEEKMKKIIVPAVIAKNQEELEGILKKIADSASLIQLDIMDGKFVPNHSLDFDFQLPREKHSYEAHLMVENPKKWIESFGKRVDAIIVHFESATTSRKTIRSIKNIGKKAALALNPETKIDQIADYLDDLDQVLIMTVNPGFYGSPFLPEVMGKITELRQKRPGLDIEVDGGINPETIELVDKAGANLFVSGSYLVKSDNLQDRVNILYKRINDPGCGNAL
jgi:ribulose-phosphate 3-epimerase